MTQIVSPGGALYAPKYRERFERYAVYSLEFNAFYCITIQSWVDSDELSTYSGLDTAKRVVSQYLHSHNWNDLLVVPCDVESYIAYDNRGKYEYIYTPDFKYAQPMTIEDINE